jgi:hypothetical protein
MGHLDPFQGLPQLGVSCVDYKLLENKNGGRRKAIQEQELKEHEKKLSLSSHYLLGVELGLIEALILLNLCLELIALALVLNAMAENLDSLKWWWLGVFIAPTTKPTVGVGLLSMGAPDSPVRHRTLSGAPATSPNR